MSLTVVVFPALRFVRPRAGGPSQFAIELIARRSGSVMYRSKTCATEPEARVLALAYLRRTHNGRRLVLDNGAGYTLGTPEDPGPLADA